MTPSIFKSSHLNPIVGFLPHRACEEAVQALIQFIEENLGPTHAVFVDFSAAFDNVNRKKLMDTVRGKFGIKGKTARILEEILKPNSLIIDNGFDLSAPIDQHKGVAQGASVSPPLFVMFVNSLLERLERRKVLVKMYADDLVVAAEEPDELQRALSVITIWSKENGMPVSADKTKAMKFRPAGPLGKQRLYILHISFIVIFYRYRLIVFTLN